MKNCENFSCIGYISKYFTICRRKLIEVLYVNKTYFPTFHVKNKTLRPFILIKRSICILFQQKRKEMQLERLKKLILPRIGTTQIRQNDQFSFSGLVLKKNSSNLFFYIALIKIRLIHATFMKILRKN